MNWLNIKIVEKGVFASLLRRDLEEDDPSGKWEYLVQLQLNSNIVYRIPCINFMGAAVLTSVLNRVLPHGPQIEEIKL